MSVRYREAFRETLCGLTPASSRHHYNHQRYASDRSRFFKLISLGEYSHGKYLIVFDNNCRCLCGVQVFGQLAQRRQREQHERHLAEYGGATIAEASQPDRQRRRERDAHSRGDDDQCRHGTAGRRQQQEDDAGAGQSGSAHRICPSRRGGPVRLSRCCQHGLQQRGRRSRRPAAATLFARWRFIPPPGETRRVAGAFSQRQGTVPP